MSTAVADPYSTQSFAQGYAQQPSYAYAPQSYAPATSYAAPAGYAVAAPTGYTIQTPNTVQQPTYAVAPAVPTAVANATIAVVQAPAAPVAPQIVESVEEKLARLESTVSGFLQLLQESKKLPKREIILKKALYKIEKVKVVVPVQNYYGVQTFKEDTVEQKVPVTIKVPKEYQEPFVKPDGTIGTRTLKIDQEEQKYEDIHKLHIQRIPNGCDVTEYCSEENQAVSAQLFQALKSAADSLTDVDTKIKDAFKNADQAVWGPFPTELAQGATITTGPVAAPTVSGVTITAK